MVGIFGKGMLMLFGGIDFLVVGYLVLKCGVDIEVVYFVSFFYISLGVLKKVYDLICKLIKFGGNI